MTDQFTDKTLHGIETALNTEFDEPENTESKELALVDFVDFPAPVDTGNELEDDFDLARQTLRSVLLNSGTIIKDLMVLAKDREAARLYESLTAMLKTVADTSKDLIELHKKKPEKNDEDDGAKGGINVEKGVFVGKLSDLLKKMDDGEDGEIQENG